jgi:hypothetical protein
VSEGGREKERERNKEREKQVCVCGETGGEQAENKRRTRETQGVKEGRGEGGQPVHAAALIIKVRGACIKALLRLY